MWLYYDSETGLHYNYYRDYNPAIVRYVEADPIGIKQGNNHLYGYVENNPINFVDPYGEVSCSYSITGKTLNCTTRDYGTLSCYALSGNNRPEDQCLKKGSSEKFMGDFFFRKSAKCMI